MKIRTWMVVLILAGCGDRDPSPEACQPERQQIAAMIQAGHEVESNFKKYQDMTFGLAAQAADAASTLTFLFGKGIVQLVDDYGSYKLILVDGSCKPVLEAISTLSELQTTLRQAGIEHLECFSDKDKTSGFYHEKQTLR